MRAWEIASKNLQGIVESEISQGIPKKNIFIGGFSQGGAVALYTTLKQETPLAGCIALSTYIPGNVPPVPEGGPKCETPVLQAHGEVDEVVPFARGRQTFGILEKFVKAVEFKAYPNMGHEATMDELDLVKDFINKHSAKL